MFKIGLIKMTKTEKNRQDQKNKSDDKTPQSSSYLTIFG